MTNITSRVVYLDCNASTPVEEEVIDAVTHYMRIEYGNAGSRTHRYGTASAAAVKRAREQVARVINVDADEVILTSGGTESNNLALFGFAREAERRGKKHIISSMIEHKAVLEPLEQLSARGFEVTLIPPEPGGAVAPNAIARALRSETFLVSIMHVNNETGVLQPLRQIGEVLADHTAIFHSDAVQGFGKELDQLKTPRLDAISISGHKIFGPKGIGALAVRRNSRTTCLEPLMYGGGQERMLRPGTTPVPLAVGLGLAAEIALRDYEERRTKCKVFRDRLVSALSPLNPITHGDEDLVLPHVINMRFGDIDSEAVMLSLKDVVAISNGSACTSAVYQASHVLRAMGLHEHCAQCATRWSWCHLTPTPNWSEITEVIRSLY